MSKQTYRQNSETGEMYEVNRGHRKEVVGYDSFEPCVSPIDGGRIRNRAELTAHNRLHGVSNDRDSLLEQGERERNRKPRTSSKKERVASIIDAIERVQSSGFSRRIQYDD